MVMMSKENRKHAFSWYLLFLSISDTIFLCVYVPQAFAFYYTNCIMDISIFANCTVRYFVFLCTSEYSSFLLALMSIERFIVIVHPEKAKYLCTPLRTKLSCLILAIVLLGINAFHIVAYQVYTTDGVRFCVPRPEYDYFLDNVWPIIDGVLYTYLPSILMINFSGAIMCHIWKTKALFNQASSAQKHFPRVTFMLFSVSVFFIITTVPVTTLFIVERHTGDLSMLTFACLELLMVLNHSINFFLYCLSGSKFRNDFRKMFCAKKPTN